MTISYKTIKRAASDEFIINKSRFIGYASPCQTEEEALVFLKCIREKHRDASHNCYAYVIGENAGIMRYNDDGEPSGTAGLPMMEVLKNRSVVNCCAVVTRYFGGVLLGAGGLVRAYSHACAIALDAAQVAIMELTDRILFEVPYPLWDKFTHAIQTLPVLLEDSKFGTAVDATLLIRTKDTPSVSSNLNDLFNGKLDFLLEDTFFSAWVICDESV